MLKLIRSVVLVFILLNGLTALAEDVTPPINVHKSAEQGDVKAQARLAAMYLLGSEVDKDEQQAFEWFLKSAQQGNVEAEMIVAAMYERGLGVKNDIKLATQWYEKAAAKGNTTALALTGKNDVAKGGVAFNYQTMRLSAAKQIPTEYAKKILLTE